MWLSKSSIGRKVVMSVTGIALILFLTFHVLMNAVAIFSPEAYNKICGILGANWYAVAATLGLAALFVIHIIYAFWLTLQNKKARGNDAYEVTARPKSVEWASQNMLALGVVIACFTVLHLYQFWGRMMLAELFPCLELESVAVCPMTGAEHTIAASDGWGQIMHQFGGPLGWVVLVIYLIGFGALWFHMTHGFWSAFQSLGTNNDTWLPRLKATSNAWATIVCLLFAVEAVVFTLKAQCPESCGAPVAAYELKVMERSHHGEAAPCHDMMKHHCGEAKHEVCQSKCEAKHECGEAKHECGGEGQCQGKQEGCSGEGKCAEATKSCCEE